jgi:fructose-1-phosphate kinase PfkB-like protein
MTGRVPEGAARAESARWVRALERRGIRCVVDSSGKALNAYFSAKPSFIKVNLFEMAEALGKPLKQLSSIISLLPILHRRGLAHGAVTDGARGVLAWEGPELVLGYPSRVKRLRSPVVGAGDAFLAGYLKAWREGKSLSERVRWACASGAVVAEFGIMGFAPGRAARAARQVRLS